ncbi:MAG: 5'/3'-nucleotidase SurE [Proteobacteria bacterium]|nr:5'/3'-nucleotidase SurE [Pseudomonadota bacterium]
MNKSHPHHRILITNDDGIHAPGIKLLEEIARTITDDVWVVAPDQERSGAGHSISLTLPIRMQALGPKRFQVAGTPTDCVLMALSQCMADTPPTLLLSGINSGANLAEDVTYSGTIAAAMEGTLFGIRSIALSQVRAPGAVADFAPAAARCPELLRKVVGLEDWPAGSFININFPDVPVAEISGVRLTTQGQRPPGSFSIMPRVDARAQPYYWVKIAYTSGNEFENTDLHAIADKAVAVTPIKMDFTDAAWRARLAGVLG